MNIVRDMSLQEHGRMKIQWVQDFMPALSAIKKEFEKTKPFAGKTIAMSIHMEAKTAYLATVLKAAGAEVYATGCNPLSTQDDVAAGACVSGRACGGMARSHAGGVSGASQPDPVLPSRPVH